VSGSSTSELSVCSVLNWVFTTINISAGLDKHEDLKLTYPHYYMLRSSPFHPPSPYKHAKKLYYWSGGDSCVYCRFNYEFTDIYVFLIRPYRPQPAMRIWWRSVVTSLVNLEISSLEIPAQSKPNTILLVIYEFCLIQFLDHWYFALLILRTIEM